MSRGRTVRREFKLAAVQEVVSGARRPARVCREHGLAEGSAGALATHTVRIYPNLWTGLAPARPDQVWVAEITSIRSFP